MLAMRSTIRRIIGVAIGLMMAIGGFWLFDHRVSILGPDGIFFAFNVGITAFGAAIIYDEWTDLPRDWRARLMLDRWRQ